MFGPTAYQPEDYLHHPYMKSSSWVSLDYYMSTDQCWHGWLCTLEYLNCGISHFPSTNNRFLESLFKLFHITVQKIGTRYDISPNLNSHLGYQHCEYRRVLQCSAIRGSDHYFCFRSLDCMPRTVKRGLFYFIVTGLFWRLYVLESDSTLFCVRC